MNLTEIKGMPIGTKVYYEYGLGTIGSGPRERPGTGKGKRIVIDILKGSIKHSTNIEDVFLPTKHIEEVSMMVETQRGIFGCNKCLGANVNPSIYGLFTTHWIAMCNAEGNPTAYTEAKKKFDEFIIEITKIATMVNNAKVAGIPYLRR